MHWQERYAKTLSGKPFPYFLSSYPRQAKHEWGPFDVLILMSVCRAQIDQRHDPSIRRAVTTLPAVQKYGATRWLH
jgi:hypothetical protein